jgi:hypothetical protein
MNNTDGNPSDLFTDSGCLDAPAIREPHLPVIRAVVR